MQQIDLVISNNRHGSRKNLWHNVANLLRPGEPSDHFFIMVVRMLMMMMMMMVLSILLSFCWSSVRHGVTAMYFP